MACDRVLIYLEAEAAGRTAPDFAVHLLGDLLHAADALGCRSLQVRRAPSLLAAMLWCMQHMLPLGYGARVFLLGPDYPCA